MRNVFVAARRGGGGECSGLGRVQGVLFRMQETQMGKSLRIMSDTIRAMLHGITKAEKRRADDEEVAADAQLAAVVSVNKQQGAAGARLEYSTRD